MVTTAKATYSVTATAPSRREMVRSLRMNIAAMPVMNTSAVRSTPSVCSGALTGPARAEAPRQRRTLKTLEPTTLPTARSEWPRRAAITLVGHEFGQRSPDCDDGEPNEAFAQAEGARDGDGAIDEDAPSHEEHRQTDRGRQHGPQGADRFRRSRGIGGLAGGGRVDARGRLSRRGASRAYHPGRVADRDKEQRGPLQLAHDAVDEEQGNERRARDQDRQLATA